jgi:hypothetical protein
MTRARGNVEHLVTLERKNQPDAVRATRISEVLKWVT